MPAIITNRLRITNSDFFQNDVDDTPTYVYIGRTTEWDDEESPPDAVDSTLQTIEALDEIEGLKRIYSANMVSVIPRNNWITNTVYDEYTDNANIIDDKNPTTDDYYRFYVVTDEFNVYKCLSNNDRAESTTKPTGSLTTPFETPDGYKWKFMYTISSADAFTYMTPNWIPCKTIYVDDSSSQWSVQEAAIAGTIDNIVVTEGGILYDSADLPTVTITGDGTGATAIAEVDDDLDEVVRITITNQGSGYTTATVAITGTTGSGATASAVISPINGHGSNAREELGAVYKMIRIELDGDEGGDFPTDIAYRRTGILTEPRSTSTGVILNIADVDGFAVGDTVTGTTSTEYGVIGTINKTRLEISLASDSGGAFVIGEPLTNGSGASTTVTDYKTGQNIPLTSTTVDSTLYESLTGDLLYFSNRESITRGASQIEELRFIIHF